MCDCEFTPYKHSDEESWHFLRVCGFCGKEWYGLHCPHDGYQNPCPECDKRPTTVIYRKENKMGVWIKYRDKNGDSHRTMIDQEFFEGIEFGIDTKEGHSITAGIAWKNRLSLSSPIGTRLLVLPSSQNWLYLFVERE